MDTDKLIAELSSESVARKPLEPTRVAALLWSVSACLFLSALGAYIGFREDLQSLLFDTKGLAEVMLLAISTALSCYVALDLRYPQTPMLFKNKAALSIVGIVWLILIAVHIPSVTLADPDLIMRELSQVFNECMLELCAVSLLPVIYIAYLSKRGATTNRAATGFACTIAAASLGALLMRLLCPDDGHLHLLLWHFLPVLGLAAVGTVAGKTLFRW